MGENPSIAGDPIALSLQSAHLDRASSDNSAAFMSPDTISRTSLEDTGRLSSDSVDISMLDRSDGSVLLATPKSGSGSPTGER